jgi:hypothetical protein
VRRTNPEFDTILESHAIPIDDASPERDNDFSRFLLRRERLLGQLVKTATGGVVDGYGPETGEDGEAPEQSLIPGDADAPNGESDSEDA